MIPADIMSVDSAAATAEAAAAVFAYKGLAVEWNLSVLLKYVTARGMGEDFYSTNQTGRQAV